MIFPTIIMSVEKWKFNSEYGVYVSTLGHFRDRQKRNLSVKINQKGYCYIVTEKGLAAAHRLVLLTWRPIPDRENMTVDHLNHNKRDNSLGNLEWVTAKENRRRAKEDFIRNFNDISELKNVENYSKEKVLVNGVVLSTVDAKKLMMGIPNLSETKIDKELKKALLYPTQIFNYGNFTLQAAQLEDN